MTRGWAIFLAIASMLLFVDIVIWGSKLDEPRRFANPLPPAYRVYTDPTPTPVPSPWPGWPAGR